MRSQAQKTTLATLVTALAAVGVATTACDGCDGETTRAYSLIEGEADAGTANGRGAPADTADENCISLQPGVNVIEQSGTVCPGHYLDQRVQIIVGADGVGIRGEGVILEQNAYLEGAAIEVSDRARVTVDGFTIRGRYQHGIEIWWLEGVAGRYRGNTSVTVSNNVVEGLGRDGGSTNSMDSGSSFSGILVANIDKTLITGNTVSGYDFCLNFDGGDYSRVIGNRVRDCNFGIFAGFINRAGMELAENSVNTAENGLWFGGRDSSIHHNAVSGTSSISVQGCGNAIYGNDFRNNEHVNLGTDCNDTHDNQL